MCKSSEEEQLDQKRLVLDVSVDGVVTGVNPGATKAVFGIAPSALVSLQFAATCSRLRREHHVMASAGVWCASALHGCSMQSRTVAPAPVPRPCQPPPPSLTPTQSPLPLLHSHRWATS